MTSTCALFRSTDEDLHESWQARRRHGYDEGSTPSESLPCESEYVHTHTRHMPVKMALKTTHQQISS